MNLLAIETATDACSCALAVGAQIQVRERHAPRVHAECLLAMVDELLGAAAIEPAALDAVVFGRGPGSFTGVRIAAAVTQGLAWPLSLPVVPVSTLHGLAIGARRRGAGGRVLAALDARMGEVYWGMYAGRGWLRPVGRESVCPPVAVEIPPGERWWGAGPGWAVHGEALRARLGGRICSVLPELLPSARDLIGPAREVLDRGEAVEARAVLPVYLRDRVASPRGGAAAR